VGVNPAQIFGDHCPRAVRIVQHLVVPESQHAVALALQEPSAARFLFRRRIVLAAIDFDDQSRLVANKVGNEAPDRHLTAKSISFGLARSQHPPELFLGFGHLAAERPGALVGALGWPLIHCRSGPFAASPPPRPSPIKGEGVLAVPRRRAGCVRDKARSPQGVACELAAGARLTIFQHYSEASGGSDDQRLAP
jgi:hypothetical protein